MHQSWISNLKTWSRAAPIVALTLVAAASASQSSAQIHCAIWVDTLLDTSDNCVNDPRRERAMEVEGFDWKGHEYVILNEGNEFSIYNIDDPLNPDKVATSSFNFGTRGDSDYDLTRFDVCDECRYGILAHKVKRTVVFDLGAGATPVFAPGAYEIFPVLKDQSLGGNVFRKGGQDYLIAADLSRSCVGGSGLYTIDAAGNLGLIECLEVGGSPLLVRGLQSLETGGITYLYLAASNGPVHVFRADGAGAALALVYQDSPLGMFGRRYELSIDANNLRAASANFDDLVVTIWGLADPAHPVLQHVIPATATIVSLRSPSPNTASTLVMAMIGWTRSTRTFIIDDGVPDEFETTYWSDESLDHNDLPVCGFENGAALSSDGSALFLSRNAVHQVFDLQDCLQPTPAVADLNIIPSEVFPGDTVTVIDNTAGQVDRLAIWITEEPAGTLVAGNATPSATNPHEIDYQIPQNLPWDVGYRAHIVVESDDLPPADPSFDTDISINRAPQATIAIEPSAVIVGESVTLTATAEGNPDANPYTWTIDPPASPSFDRNGSPAIVTLDEAGAWDFHLTVDYLHGTAAGGAYQATADITGFDVTSVAADFTISPASPLHTQDIILDGSISKPVGGNLSYAWTVEEVDGPGTYTGCPEVAVCTIPGGSLQPDTWYTVDLTATNNDDGATSSISQNVLVGDGNVQPTIRFRPTDPEIGTTVVFAIDGVPGDIDKANWTMGGTGCDGFDPTPECIPSLWNDCKALAFEYASGGTKTVGLTVEVGSNTFTAEPVLVSVAWSGSCDASGLSISFSPTSPEIGEDIVFTLDGIVGTIEKAIWNFGDAGCDGPSTDICVPNLWDDCSAISFSYASGGAKSVNVSLELSGGGVDSAGPVWLTVAWSGSCSGSGASCANVLLEPGFEGGSGSAWSEYSSNGYNLITMNRPRSGSFSAWLGGHDDEESSVWQVPPIDARAISATLSYWYWMESEDICEHDKGGVTVNGLLADGHDFDLCLNTNTFGYVQSEILDLLPYAGTTPEILFFATTDSSEVSSLYIDDAILEVCIPGVKVFSDDFESGDASAWSNTEP